MNVVKIWNLIVIKQLVFIEQPKPIRSIFPSRDKNGYKLCVIYKGECSCGSSYIGETTRDKESRWNEHNNPTKSSEASKHFQTNIDQFYMEYYFKMLQKMLGLGRT